VKLRIENRRSGSAVGAGGRGAAALRDPVSLRGSKSLGGVASLRGIVSLGAVSSLRGAVSGQAVAVAVALAEADGCGPDG
jgi:hypothetical protein